MIELLEPGLRAGDAGISAARAGAFAIPETDVAVGVHLCPHAPEVLHHAAELAELLCARLELVELVARAAVVDQMIGVEARPAEGIEIRGYGSFTVRRYHAYDGRNPRTGKAVSVPAKRLPFFKVGKELKVLVNQGTEPIPAGDDGDDDA